MDEGKKKIITIGIAAVCLVLAIAITLGTRGGRGGGVKEGKRWVKCANPDCEAGYQMTNKEYADEMAEININPMMSSSKPALVCRECEEESIYAAIKCSNEECGAVFFKNPDRRDFPDRCSECGVSEKEESLGKE